MTLYVPRLMISPCVRVLEVSVAKQWPIILQNYSKDVKYTDVKSSFVFRRKSLLFGAGNQPRQLKTTAFHVARFKKLFHFAVENCFRYE